MKKTTAEIKCYSGLNPQAEKLWAEAIAVVAAAPSSECGMNFDEKAFILFSLLGIDINDQNLKCAYHSALSAESLAWLLDRIAWVTSRSA